MIMAVLFLVSYSFVFQPFIPPIENVPTDLYKITYENAYLAPNETSGYNLYVNGRHFGSISTEEMQMEPYNTLPITEYNKEKE